MHSTHRGKSGLTAVLLTDNWLFCTLRMPQNSRRNIFLIWEICSQIKKISECFSRNKKNELTEKIFFNDKRSSSSELAMILPSYKEVTQISQKPRPNATVPCSSCWFYYKGECNSNLSNFDAFVERVVKNNRKNNRDRHRICKVFWVYCFVLIIT